MNKKTLMIVAPVVLIVAVAAIFFLRPKAPVTSADELAKQPGPVYTMVEPFVVNLADRGEQHLAKVGIALQVSKASASAVPEAKGSVVPKIEQDAQVRDIVISAIQSHTSRELATPEGRQEIKKTIVMQVNKQTDLRIVDVYYTEFAVQ